VLPTGAGEEEKFTTSEVFTAVDLKFTVLCDITPCSLVESYRYFGETVKQSLSYRLAVQEASLKILNLCLQSSKQEEHYLL
jgi:hypothetical protein